MHVVVDKLIYTTLKKTKRKKDKIPKNSSDQPQSVKAQLGVTTNNGSSSEESFIEDIIIEEHLTQDQKLYQTIPSTSQNTINEYVYDSLSPTSSLENEIQKTRNLIMEHKKNFKNEKEPIKLKSVPENPASSKVR
jgi:hypothetical protein